MDYYNDSMALFERMKNDEPNHGGYHSGRGMSMGPVTIFDSTLRDGAQGTGVAFSLEDKLQAVRLLDQVGVQYVEAGNPGSNPKDAEFFQAGGQPALKERQAGVLWQHPPEEYPRLGGRQPGGGAGGRHAGRAASLASAGNSTWTGCWKPPMRRTSV